MYDITYHTKFVPPFFKTKLGPWVEDTVNDTVGLVSITGLVKLDAVSTTICRDVHFRIITRVRMYEFFFSNPEFGIFNRILNL